MLAGADFGFVGDAKGDPLGDADANWLAPRAAMLENGVQKGDRSLLSLT